MKIQFRCGCGGINYVWRDWVCHFRYRGLVNGMKNLLLTRVERTRGGWVRQLHLQ